VAAVLSEAEPRQSEQAQDEAESGIGWCSTLLGTSVARVWPACLTARDSAAGVVAAERTGMKPPGCGRKKPCAPRRPECRVAQAAAAKVPPEADDDGAYVADLSDPRGRDQRY
jgi:hypothetical protein